MFSFKGIGVKVFALVMAIVLIIAGVYLTFFHSSGFVPTTATIVSIDMVTDGMETAETKQPSYAATVSYTVDGTEYTALLDQESPNYQVGQTLRVRYDPNNPAVVHGGFGLSIYAIVVGVVILAVIIVSELRKRRSLRQVKALQEKNGLVTYPASVPGPERQLYFLTDLGTVKAGQRLEDADRNILYQAKMTKYTLTTPYGFDFIDHEHGKTTPHLVGHEEATDWGNSLLLDNHFTFTLDGEDIWKHLKRNGITVESSLVEGLRTQYCIQRDGQPIAVATSTSQYVHEEDEAAHQLAGAVPVQGFYRVSTTETDLSLLFVTLLAFARSGASDAHGGTRRVVWNTLKNS